MRSARELGKIKTFYVLEIWDYESFSFLSFFCFVLLSFHYTTYHVHSKKHLGEQKVLVDITSKRLVRIKCSPEGIFIPSLAGQ